MIRRVGSLFVLLAFATVAHAQDKLRPVTPDDYFTLTAVAGFAPSPDGKLVAYSESRWDESENGRKSHLWNVSTDGKSKPQRLTNDLANDRDPIWSASGKSIYVLANRKRNQETKPPYDGSTQIWQIDIEGGSPTAVTTVEGGISAYDYAPKANAMFYSVESTATDDDPFTRLRKQFDKVEYGHGARRVSTIHKLDVQTWRSEKVVAENRYVREFKVALNGQRIGMITAADDSVVVSEGRSRVEVWDAATGKVSTTDEAWKKSARSPWPWLENLAWNSAGDRLAFQTIFDAHPAETILQSWDSSEDAWKSDRVRRPDAVHVRGYGSPVRWLDDHAVAYLGEKAGRVGVFGYGVRSRDSTGSFWDDAVVSDFVPLPNSQAISLESSPTGFAELVVRGPETRKLTDLNPQVKNWQLPTVTHVTWKAPDGTAIGGVLELPFGHKPGEKLPLVVAIHGGPTTAVHSELSFDPHNGRLYFAAKGYAVLCPNYRGSTGYGDKYVTDLIGNENDIEVKDILAGIQHLIKEGIADPNRVAVMGWSNGGYLTNCLITLKDPPVKIKAASSGAGILDTVAEWGFNDEPAYPRVFKKGHPWETPEIYKKTSPTYGLGNVTTPTLIHVGGNDVRCPPGHSRMLYRALKEYVNVPTELVVYTGEAHGLSKMANRRAKMEWDLAWFEKYVK